VVKPLAKIVLPLAFWMVFDYPAFAESLTKQPLTKETELLGGRLIVTMPDSSTTEPTNWCLTCAPDRGEDETRVVLTSGRQELALAAKEVHATAGSDFKADVDRFLDQSSKTGHGKFSVREQCKSAGGLDCVYVQEELGSGQDSFSFLIESCFVKNTDGTVQRLSLSANREAYKNLKSYLSLVHAILDSVKAGTKKVSFESSTVEVDSRSGLSIKIPSSIMTATQEGVDFRVLELYPLRELGTPISSLLLYVGSHPDFHPSSDSKRIPVTIMDQKLDWRVRESPAQTRLMETLVKLPYWSGLAVHLILSYGNEEDRKRLMAVAETLFVSNKDAPLYSSESKAAGLLASGNPKEALADYEKVIEGSPKDTNALFREADCYKALGDQRSAAGVYTKILEHNPQNELALSERVTALTDLGEYQKALDDCNRSVTLGQNNYFQLSTRAALLEKMGNYEAAISDYSKEIDRLGRENNSHGRCYEMVNRARCYRLQGKTQKAIADCNWAISFEKADVAFDERASNYDIIGRADKARLDRYTAQDIRVHTFKGPVAGRESSKIASTHIELPDAFIGTWDVDEGFRLMSADQKFCDLVTKRFPEKRKSVWQITGTREAGYLLDSTQGFKAKLILDKLDNMAAYLHFDFPVDGNAVSARFRLSLKPNNKEMDGFERFEVKPNEGDKVGMKVLYQFVASRRVK
jgi:tetratricopeptide (TPR) repeat protein